MTEYICPHCGKPIDDDEALLCLYCGEDLERGVGFLGKVKYPPLKVITTVVIIVVLSGFLLWVTR
ncbi:MAG: zinc-ribbon domain-containing protein [Candidatus Tantalella remota]|nr:zinc-ribbon domain-containing protein [Candidatus Tantalella remota]